jgi:von Willebrand factor type D domain
MSKRAHFARVAVLVALAGALLLASPAPAVADVNVASDLHGAYDACIAKARAVGHPEEVDELDNNHQHKTTVEKPPNLVRGGHQSHTLRDDDASHQPPGTDATILWDPDGSGPITDDPGVSEDACATLFHEMNHANDDETGQNYNYSSCMTRQPGGKSIDWVINIAEVNATRAENIYRAAVDAALDRAAASGQPPPVALAGQARLPPRTIYKVEIEPNKYEAKPLPPFAANPSANSDAEGCLPPPPPTQPRTGGGCSVSAPGLSVANGSGGASSCAVSNGDPHLTTFDQFHYDFQAVGEFIMTKADSGDLEVQSRQAAFGNRTDVSVNTAAAMNVAGDPVGVYLTDSGVQIRVAHTVNQLAGDFVRLGHGGVVSRLDEGSIVVTWPDGSQVLLVPIGAWGFRLSIHLADARQGHVHGLLGDFDGKPDDDLLLRNGGLISKPTFEKLYPGFADSWRVNQQESLFDYDRGQGTASFTNRRYPTKAASAATLPTRAIAAEICRQAGVTDPQLVADCILDVGVTGQVEFARSAAASQLAFVGAGRPSGTTSQNLTFSGAIADTLTVASTECTLIRSGGQFTATLVGDLGGKKVDMNIRAIDGFHGAGEYPVGPVPHKGYWDVLLNYDNYAYIGATGSVGGRFTINADEKSGTVDTDVMNERSIVEHIKGDWTCTTVLQL